MSDVCAICLFENCEFDGAVLRGFKDKASGDFDMPTYPGEASIWTANQRSRVVFNEEVREGTGVGSADGAGYGDLFVLMMCLVVIEFDNTHDLALGK